MHLLGRNEGLLESKGKNLLNAKNLHAKIECNCICDSVNQISSIAFIWTDIVVISNKIGSFSSFPILRRSWNWEVVYFLSSNMWVGGFKSLASCSRVYV